MGYYTRFKVTVDPAGMTEAIIAALGDIWRMYATGGQVEKVEAVWTMPEMTIKRPERIYKEIMVSLAGVDVPVDVECLLGEDKDVLYKRAREILREMLA